MMKLTRFKLALLLYVAFDFLIGGHCGGLLPLGELMAAQSGPPAIGNITSAGSTCSTTSVPTNCVILQLDAASGAATIDISGTWAATLQFEGFTGVTWTNINCTPPNSTTAASSSTANGAWQCNVAAYSAIRVRGSAYTSGTAVVYINSAHASAKSSGGGAVYASGLGTNNVIPKGNGANQLADSSITDNGTTVTTAEVVNLTHAADTTNAIIEFNSVATTGLMFDASTYVGLKVDSTNWLGVSNTSNGPSTFQLPSSGCMGWSSGTGMASAINDTDICRNGAANAVRIGISGASSTPSANSLQIGETGSGSNIVGGAGTVKPGPGTGNAAGTKLCLQRNLMTGTGSSAQAQIDGYCVGPSKTLSNTSATAQSLVNISVPSNSAGGVEGTITLTCSDGTNFDSETQSFNTSFVNKAGAMTVTAPVITATTAANNSGSCTAGITAVAGTNSVDIKVTPVFGTIVPTTVTSYIALRNNGTGNATFN